MKYSANNQLIGLLLTGGNSVRFNGNKLTAGFDNTTVAQRCADILSGTCGITFEAGWGHTTLPNIPNTCGVGALEAIAITTKTLRKHGLISPNQSVLVFAGDMPLMRSATLSTILFWPGESSVVPVVKGHRQILASRWSALALNRAIELSLAGEFKIQSAIIEPDTQLITLEDWERDPSDFLDVDTKSDLELALEIQQHRTKEETPR